MVCLYSKEIFRCTCKEQWIGLGSMFLIKKMNWTWINVSNNSHYEQIFVPKISWYHHLPQVRKSIFWGWTMLLDYYVIVFMSCLLTFSIKPFLQLLKERVHYFVRKNWHSNIVSHIFLENLSCFSKEFMILMYLKMTF